MPHMMPMLWIFIFMSSFLFLFLLSTMIYFFYMPTLTPKKSNIKLHKWNWTW
uniref:ATP synthase F0 subunit 8 n=1 Tax=Camponotus concavus TaxID=605056 RepID=A0A4D6NZ76_9HYME|nr:ATP synthase F0 subunit 8 [Camponotus concavus]QCE31808.1 ATP synthase F0 subunit 8 [Camponotus concavus]